MTGSGIYIRRDATWSCGNSPVHDEPKKVDEDLEKSRGLAIAEIPRLIETIGHLRAELAQTLVREAASVVAEREACAKVAEAYEPRCESCPRGVSIAIRARGTK